MKKLLILILVIMMIPITLADLEISPSGFEGSVYLDLEEKAEITLKNTYDFSIFNINFSPIEYVKFPIINKLDPNETRKINITVETEDVFERTSFNSVVKFWYYSLINLDPVAHNVNITKTNFTPEEINIRIGDTIIFNNRGNFFSSIKDDYSPFKYFDKEIQVNQSVTVSNFNEIDSFFYTDWNIWKKGKIIVEDPTDELVNNPDYNKVFTITFDSIYTESHLGIEIYPESNITMEYNEFQELNLRIWNDGNVTIHNIELKSNDYEGWFEFDENNFDLTKGQNRFVDLRITPEINESDETNRTYEIEIIADADNAYGNTDLRIFVPFSDEIYKIYYGSDFWEGREEYCNKYPQDITCNPPPKIEIREKVIIQNSTLEYSKEEAIKNDREQSERLSGIEGLQEKQTKSMNIFAEAVDILTNKVSNLVSEINISNKKAEESLKKEENTELNFYLMVLFVVLISGLGFFYYYTQKKIKNKIRTEHP